VEELRLELLLPATPAYVELLQEFQVKEAKICEEFYTTDAMTNREWMQGGYELRHIMTRLSVHGFHHRLCQAKSFHEPGPECVCIRCGNHCKRYHVWSCSLRTDFAMKCDQQRDYYHCHTLCTLCAFLLALSSSAQAHSISEQILPTSSGLSYVSIILQLYMHNSLGYATVFNSHYVCLYSCIPSSKLKLPNWVHIILQCL
jgi:hypothetical protein